MRITLKLITQFPGLSYDCGIGRGVTRVKVDRHVGTVDTFGEGLETYAVKDGIDMFTASCLHPDVTEKGIREGVAKALDADTREAYRMEAPYTFAFEWNSTTIASTCELIPGVEKPTPRTTEFTTENLPEAMGLIFTQLLLGLQVGQKGIYS